MHYVKINKINKTAIHFKWCPAQYWTCITKHYSIKNLHSSGKIHCLESSRSAHHTRQNTTMVLSATCRDKTPEFVSNTTVLPVERLICPAIASTGRKHDHFSRLFYFVPITHSWETYWTHLPHIYGPYRLSAAVNQRSTMPESLLMAVGSRQGSAHTLLLSENRKHQVILQQTELSLRKNSLTTLPYTVIALWGLAPDSGLL